MGTWEHIKLKELPRHNALGFFCSGRSIKIHIEIKKGVVCETLNNLWEGICYSSKFLCMQVNF